VRGAFSGVSNRLYTVDSSRLSIYYIGSNVAPKLLGTLPLATFPVGVHVSDGRAYVACGQDGMVVIDVGGPTKPLRLGSCDTPGCATAVRTFSSHALVGDSYGIQAVNVSNPVHPVSLSGYDTGLMTRGVRVSGGKAYVLSADLDHGFGSDSRSRLEILDVNNSTQPVLFGSYQ
jgi:hypothetical protein